MTAVVPVTFVCGVCLERAQGTSRDIPCGWDEATLLRRAVSFCERCKGGLGSRHLQDALHEVLCAHLIALNEGDEVELLVDGIHGKYKGRRGVVTHADGDSCGVRVPDALVSDGPGKTRTYVGPYLREQLRLVRRGTFQEAFEAARPGIMAKLKAEFRRVLEPFLSTQETLLAVPAWTPPAAAACGLSLEILNAAVAAELCETRLPHRWDPKTGAVSHHEEDREFVLTERARTELLESVHDQGQRGHQRLRSTVAICARRISDAGVQRPADSRESRAVGPNWIAIARRAEDPDAAAHELGQRFDAALKGGSTGNALGVIEDGRLLEKIIGDARFSWAIEDAARRLNAHHSMIAAREDP